MTKKIHKASPTLADLEDDRNYPTADDKRRRGYEFETYVFDLLEKQGLLVRRPYKIKRGKEQIDGGIYLEGKWYLVECKWHAMELPVSEVYAFKGKVDGKLAGTIGFFISWSGFSEDCADALAFGKELNVLLFDSRAVKEGDSGNWAEVIKERLKDAALSGEIYKAEKTVIAASKPAKVKTGKGASVKRGGRKGSSSTLAPISPASPPATTKRLEAFVEGAVDGAVVSQFLASAHPEVTADVYVCHGKLQAIRRARATPKVPGVARMLLLDADGNPSMEQDAASDEIDLVMAVEPEIEAIFFPELTRPKERFVSEAELEKIRPIALVERLMPKAIAADALGIFARLSAFIEALEPVPQSRRKRQ